MRITRLTFLLFHYLREPLAKRERLEGKRIAQGEISAAMNLLAIQMTGSGVTSAYRRCHNGPSRSAELPDVGAPAQYVRLRITKPAG
jgi:hypothetical protein